MNQSKGLLQTMLRGQMLEPIRFFGPDRAGWFLRAMVRVTFFGAPRVAATPSSWS
jgi:hypothetical protein